MDQTIETELRRLYSKLENLSVYINQNPEIDF